MNNPAPQWHIQVLTVFFATLFGLCVYDTLGSTFMLRRSCTAGMQAHHITETTDYRLLQQEATQRLNC